MANQSVLELAVGTGKWDAGLKKAKSALDNFTQANGGLQQALDKESQKMQKFVQMMGGMESTAKTAKGQMNDYKSTIEQLTMQYNRMSEAQKKTIGQDYLQAIEQMKQKYQSVNEEIQEMNRSLNNVKLPDMNAGGGGLFAGLGDKMSGALQVFGGNMLTKAAGAVAGFGTEIAGMVQQGIELAKQGEGIRIAFERLGRGDILDGLRQATHGTVTDLELMKAAVKFNDFKLPVEELGTMLAFAQQKAKDTGQSVDYMVDSIVTGLGRKSLMILDNLGLSAAEIKDKMAETGDMTKAVGEIIREQMAKAGDYVETAADRAAQANVSLQNKMEELGRKFAPVEEASSQLWTSMKIGILDIIGGPLATLLNQLTEAGRLKNQLNNMNGEPGSGNTKVDQQLKKLNVIKKGGGSDYIFNATLSGMMEDYNRQIMALDAQIKNGGKRPGAGSGESQDVRYLQQKMDALKIMRDQLAAGAKELNKPIKIESNIPDVTGGGSGRSGGGGRTDKVVEDSIDEILAKQWETASRKMATMADSLRGEDTGPSDIWKTLTNNANESADSIKTLTDALGALNESEGISREGTGEEKKEEQVKLYEQMGKLSGDIGSFAGGLSSISSGLKGLGIELPKEVDAVIGAISGISQIISGVGTIISLFGATEMTSNTIALGTNTVMMAGLIDALVANAAISLIPFANGGIVPHAAGGWMVPGNDHADRTPVLVSSGELILNSAQQNALANELQGNGMQNLHLWTEVSGRNLVVVIENDLKARGKGQLATFK